MIWPRMASYKERIQHELRCAAHEFDAWVDADELRRRVAPENELSYRNRLTAMVKSGDARVDRSRGRGSYRYALFTPMELEMFFTTIVLYGERWIKAVSEAQDPQTRAESRSKTTTSPSLVSTPS